MLVLSLRLALYPFQEPASEGVVRTVTLLRSSGDGLRRGRSLQADMIALGRKVG